MFFVFVCVSYLHAQELIVQLLTESRLMYYSKKRHL